MRDYWFGLTTVAKIVHVLAVLFIALLIVAVWMGATVTPAAADGYEPSYKERISYRKPDVREHLTSGEKAELKRIHARAMRRMKAERDAFARSIRKPVRYAQRSRYDVTAPRNTCLRTVTATGPERPTRGFAHGAAVKAWKRVVRRHHGTEYADWSYARNADVNCSKTSIGVWPSYSCDVIARPCRGI